jgi:hypothetical protein
MTFLGWFRRPENNLEEQGDPVNEKKKKKDGEKDAQELTKGTEKPLTPKQMEQLLAHPMVQRMAAQVSVLQRMFEQLPEAIGRAVAQAKEVKPPSWSAAIQTQRGPGDPPGVAALGGASQEYTCAICNKPQKGIAGGISFAHGSKPICFDCAVASEPPAPPPAPTKEG